jgi:hypothetical protein
MGPSEEDGKMAIIKIKTHQAKWLLDLTGVNMAALSRASSNCKRQTRPLVREGAPHQ